MCAMSWLALEKARVYPLPVDVGDRAHAGNLMSVNKGNCALLPNVPVECFILTAKTLSGLPHLWDKIAHLKVSSPLLITCISWNITLDLHLKPPGSSSAISSAVCDTIIWKLREERKSPLLWTGCRELEKGCPTVHTSQSCPYYL